MLQGDSRLLSSSRSSLRSGFERLPTRGIVQHKHARIKLASRAHAFPGSAWRRHDSGLRFKHRNVESDVLIPMSRINQYGAARNSAIPVRRATPQRRDAQLSVEFQRHTDFCRSASERSRDTWYSSHSIPDSRRLLPHSPPTNHRRRPPEGRRSIPGVCEWHASPGIGVLQSGA